MLPGNDTLATAPIGTGPTIDYIAGVSIALPAPAIAASGEYHEFAARVSITLPPASTEAYGGVPVTGGAAVTVGSLVAVEARHWRPTIDVVPDEIVYYTLHLTGDADGLPDLALPLHTFQCRHRDGGSSYGHVSVPNGAAYIDGIEARPAGDLVVTYYQGDVSEIVMQFRPTYIRLDEGGRSASVTMSGNFSAGDRAAKRFSLLGVSYRSYQTSAIRYRAAPRGDLRPGDIARYRDDSRVVREIAWSVGPGMAQMEVTAD